MTKRELINALEYLPDDMPLCIYQSNELVIPITEVNIVKLAPVSADGYFVVPSIGVPDVNLIKVIILV